MAKTVKVDGTDDFYGIAIIFGFSDLWTNFM